MLFAQADKVNDFVDKLKNNDKLYVYVAVGAAVLFVLFILYKIATGRRGAPDLQSGQREKLAEFPPPPPVGDRQLKVNGMPVRIRLVVVAPTGKANDDISADEVYSLLNEISHGLGTAARSDKPRIRVWPPQLSVAGFAPTFHRLVDATDPSKKGSRWIKIAGSAKTGQRPILLGMAVLAEESTSLGELHMNQTDWQEMLQVSR
jgi:hypothetical protein